MERYAKAIDELLKAKLDGPRENDSQAIHFAIN